MSTIQFGGVISGLNTQSIIDALMTAQKQPLTDLQNQESTLKAQSTAYGQLGTAVDDLVASIKNFTVTAAGSSRIGISADSSVFTATATSSALISQYDISVDRLATATRAVSTNSMGAPVTASDTSNTLQALNLPGSVTAGQISAIVDGVIVHYTVGDPTVTTLAQVMDGFGQAIQDQLRAAGPSSSPAATATFSVVDNKLQLTIAGADDALHSISFGAASDSSNALGMFGIASATASKATNPTLTGTTNLGVTKMNGALDNAGLSGLISTQAGVLTINGVSISYDTTKDSMSTLISRINNSSAGVIASVDRTNDQLVLDPQGHGRDGDRYRGWRRQQPRRGPQSGPGTTNAQKIGNTAQVTVDGRSITSVSNTVTNAIDGVTLNLLKQSPLGLAQGSDDRSRSVGRDDGHQLVHHQLQFARRHSRQADGNDPRPGRRHRWDQRPPGIGFDHPNALPEPPRDSLRDVRKRDLQFAGRHRSEHGSNRIRGWLDGSAPAGFDPTDCRTQRRRRSGGIAARRGDRSALRRPGETQHDRRSDQHDDPTCSRRRRK